MRDGERVTTGSEPRRLIFARRLRGMADNALIDGHSPYKEETRGLFRSAAEELEKPGHDEQTEARKNIERMRELTDEVARLNAQIHGPWQPDPRTVAAVAEHCHDRADNALMPGARTWFRVVADSIERWAEERFKPSAPGGTDGH